MKPLLCLRLSLGKSLNFCALNSMRELGLAQGASIQGSLILRSPTQQWWSIFRMSKRLTAITDLSETRLQRRTTVTSSWDSHVSYVILNAVWLMRSMREWIKSVLHKEKGDLEDNFQL